MESVDQSQTKFNELTANQSKHECQIKRISQSAVASSSANTVNENSKIVNEEVTASEKSLPSAEGNIWDLRAVSLPAPTNPEFQGLPEGSTVGGFSLGLLKENNTKLRKQVKYMENLGVLVTDFKQENQNLVEKNTQLLKRIEELEEMSKIMQLENDVLPGKIVENEKLLPVTSPLQVTSCDPTVAVNGKSAMSQNDEFSNPVVDDESLGRHNAPGPSSRNQETSSVNLPEDDVTSAETNHNAALQSEIKKAEGNSDDITGNEVTSIFLNEANNAHIIKQMMTSSNNILSRTIQQSSTSSKMNPVDISVQNDNQIFNEQIRQLEKMGLGLHSVDGNEASIGEPSVTSQFTKLAAVFAALAQRVVQSQKKMKYSQAFCNSLMAENEKIKLLLNQSNKEVETLRRETEEMRQTFPPTSSHPVVAKMKKQTTSSSAELGNDMDSPTILKLQARIKKLESQRSEILRVNKSWDTQYKHLKREMDRRTKALEGSALNACDHESAGISKNLTYEQKKRKEAEINLTAVNKQIELHIQEKSELSRSYASAHAQCQSLKREISHMKETQRKLKGDKSCLEAENLRLNQALEAAHSIHERRSPSFSEDNLTCPKVNLQPTGNDLYNLLSSIPTSSTHDDQLVRPPILIQELNTKIEVLQEQVKIYREDFETERRDRESCQGEKQRLEELVTRSQHEVQALTQQVRQHEQDFRREKRDKERLQRQLHWCQGRDSGNSRNRDRYHGDVTEPPAYYAHRFSTNDENGRFNRTSSRRRIRPPPPLYNMNPDWLTNNDADGDAELSYPPDDAAERPF